MRPAFLALGLWAAPSAVFASQSSGASALPPTILEMIGREPRPVTTTPWGTVELDEPDPLRDGAELSRRVPAPLTGRLRPAHAAAAPAYVLVASDGIVRQILVPAPTDDGYVFRASRTGQPDGAGGPRTRIYIIPGDGPPWRVLPVNRSDEINVVELVTVNERETLIMNDGSSIEVDNDNFEGRLDIRRRERSGNVRLSGWSADRTTKAPAEFIVVMLDRRVLATLRPGLARPDVASVLNCGMCLNSGFTLLLSRTVMGRVPVSAIRVFAVNWLHAIELTAP